LRELPVSVRARKQHCATDSGDAGGTELPITVGYQRLIGSNARKTSVQNLSRDLTFEKVASELRTSIVDNTTVIEASAGHRPARMIAHERKEHCRFSIGEGAEISAGGRSGCEIWNEHRGKNECNSRASGMHARIREWPRAQARGLAGHDPALFATDPGAGP